VALYVLRRLIQAVAVLFIVSVVTFGLIHSAPGGPAMLANPELSSEQVAQMTEELELDDPIIVQYLRWLGNVLQGDFGNSYSAIKPVTTVIAERLPNTAILAFTALTLAVVIEIPVGVLCALRRNSPLDRIVAALSFMGISVPVFWLGIMLIILFSLRLGWLPSGGMNTVGESDSIRDRVEHLILPVMVLCIGNLAELIRYTRSGMIAVLQEDYMRTARAKGLSQRAVLLGHGLRNAMIPVVTVIAIMIPRALGSAAITETVFSWPGMGRLAVESATNRDYPVVLGVTMTVALITVICSLLVDILYGVLDPRIRVR
jgi:peptide/nickel transport system permease protein